MDIDLATFDRDSLRDEIAFLHRQIAGLREELQLAEVDLAEKERLLIDAEKRLEDANDDGDLPAVIIS